ASTSRRPRCTNSSTRATSTSTASWTSPCAATPRPPPAGPVNACGCNGGCWNCCSPSTTGATRPRRSANAPPGSAGRRRGRPGAARRRAGGRPPLQRRLLEPLPAEHRRGDPAEALGERAARIGWPLPEKVAVGVLLRPAREAVAPAVGQGVLLDMEYEQPRMVVPDPDAAGRPELLHRALAGWSGAIGPPVPVADAAKSLRWAEAAVRLMERRLLPAGEVLHCTEHTEALVLLQPEELIDDLAQRCLAP